MKVMTTGLPGGTSFMEDYTYHLVPGHQKVLGAHMLEICPSIADGRPSCRDPPALDRGKRESSAPGLHGGAGPASLSASSTWVSGSAWWPTRSSSFTGRDLPKLPVAHAVWEPKPDLRTAAQAWLLAGGAHHTVLTQALKVEQLADFAEIAQIELLVIDEATNMVDFKKELRWNQAYYRLTAGLLGVEMTPNQRVQDRPIAIGCDHNALELKTLLRRHLENTATR